MFVVRKYIRARSAADAIKKDKTAPVDDVWVDNDWQKQHLASAMGFGVDAPDEDNEES